jgi:hypothetical protein
MGLKSDVFALKASGLVAVGAGNATPVVDVSSYEAGAVFLNITAKTGTFTSWVFGLQVSMNGGTTWSGVGTGLAPQAMPASFGNVGPAVDITTGAYWFPLNNFAGPLVRMAWFTAGGTDVTFSATLAVRR